LIALPAPKMRPFLLELAEKLYRKHTRNLDTLTLVFPNRRASLYFRKHLSTLLDRPAFSPRLYTIEDFISGFSPWKLPDKLELIHQLYQVYFDVVNARPDDSADQADHVEPFDQFYFWGEMLLRDFDEVDKYHVNAEHLFKDLSHQKELDTTFDFLTDEQKEFLRSFWINFDTTESANKQKFLYIWRLLPEVYKSFQARLSNQGIAYEGMLHRTVAEDLRSGRAPYNFPALDDEPSLHFVGFNALTRAEENIISYFVDRNIAAVHWDIDAYYSNNNTQEAGRFFRKYQLHKVLGKTFPADVPSNLLERSRKAASGAPDAGEIKLFGASQPVGQAKLMAQVLREHLAKGMDPEDTLIVLPDEKLLMPVLHGIAGDVETLNVTMGFPLSSTPLFNLVELLIDMQISRKDEQFNHRNVLALLGHPYAVAADAGVANSKRKDILQNNWVHVSQSYLATEVVLHRLMFAVPHAGTYTIYTITGYLKDIIIEIGSLPTLSDFDKEYAFHFITLLNRIQDIMGSAEASLTVTPAASLKEARTREREALRSFLRLFRQLIRSEKIPFRGEPLKGMQIMGVLETRNLDFKNVFVLSLNEGALPAFSSKGSYIPFTIRKAYGLPTPEHQDSTYAYLFYRMLQRAENIFLFYNSETDVLGQGEMSRYLQQLLYESGLPVQRHILHNAMRPNAITPITIKKDDKVFQSLARHCTGQRQPRELTPTALNDYIECRLKFYFRHVARIREAREVEEDLDARVLGNFLHRVMELFYRDITNAKRSTTLESTDFGNYEGKVDRIIDRVFIEAYGLDPEKEVVYEGQRLVVKEIVKRFVDRIVTIDRAYAPFTLEALESRGMNYTINLGVEGNPGVVIGGIIDRADSKGDVLRVIDYKTGKDELAFDNITNLFERQGKRNKAAFQTLLYALLFYKNFPGGKQMKLVPGLMNRINLFDDDFMFGLRHGRDFLRDATPLLAEFEEGIRALLEELYNPAIPFDQTTDVEICGFCPYRSICYR